MERAQTEIKELCNVLNVACLNRSVSVCLHVELVELCGFDCFSLLCCGQFIRIHFRESRCDLVCFL